MSAVIIIILILAILLVIFTLQNSIVISIHAFFWEISDVPLVLVLLSCVLLGYIIGAVYFYPRIWNLKKERRRLTKSNKELQQQQSVQETSQSEIKDHEDTDLDDKDDESFFKD